MLSNVVRVETFFDFKLIPNDEGDDKFVNCYVSASADRSSPTTGISTY